MHVPPLSTQRARHSAWAGLLLACTLALVGLGVAVHFLFFPVAPLFAGGAYAAWLGLSLDQYLETLDDITSPPVFPS